MEQQRACKTRILLLERMPGFRVPYGFRVEGAIHRMRIAMRQSDRKKKHAKQDTYIHTFIRKNHASLSSSVTSTKTKNDCNSTAITIDAEATAQTI